MFFFFSSRRRHTRYIGDWSSDVCSSDLKECRTGQVRRQSHDEQNGGSLLARLPRRGHVAFHGQSRKQQNREQGPADHPPERNFRKDQGSVVERIVESKIADGLDNSGKRKPEGKNQRGAVVCAAEAHQGVSGIAVAEKRPAHFQVKISLWRSCKDSLP